MSGQAGGRTREEKLEIGAIVWQQLPLLVALVLLWMLLWGTVSWLSVLSGLAVAVVVTRVFYLPPVELSGRTNVLWLFVFLGIFLWDLVRASFQVAARAFDPRGIRGNAVIAVQLHTRSDFIVTITSVVVSLVPGSIVVEVDRDRSILYLHALGARTEADIEKVRRDVLRVERGAVRALGSRADLRRLDA
ncbi:Na+/H+ antiporter subunit E [Homoserinibacter sp. YIM 151385]|uniref:Na+/H+ antiporter subunit E n=1 Tax=Homoserinibacter sp. YIM 151385 TaxID=2985506 RepID=UPI0022EFF19E|nr:Na+/H+ antiporter subunit E [Homoserinibacter sp. YIM 151385]WBU39288.1 Na+/H+ antiporter subunit E [Homoserinibacter sp. YIM 151385]